MSGREARQEEYRSKIQPLIEANGTTAYRLSKECGFDPTVFSDWKSGKSRPKIDKLIKIASRLGVGIEALI